MADGDNDEEVNRLENFDSGGNDNTTSPQAGPTSRADQLAMDFAPGGSPAFVNLLLTDPDADVPINAEPFMPAMEDGGASWPWGVEGLVTAPLSRRIGSPAVSDILWDYLTGPTDKPNTAERTIPRDGTEWINKYLDAQPPTQGRAVRDHEDEQGRNADERVPQRPLNQAGSAHLRRRRSDRGGCDALGS